MQHRSVRWSIAGLGIIASVSVGAIAGAPEAAATESCGDSSDPDVCSWVPEGCGQGQACNQYICNTTFCLFGAGGIGTRCWKCGNP
jgi:hypothetical protein